MASSRSAKAVSCHSAISFLSAPAISITYPFITLPVLCVSNAITMPPARSTAGWLRYQKPLVTSCISCPAPTSSNRSTHQHYPIRLDSIHVVM